VADRTVSVALIAKVEGFVGGIGTAARATRGFVGELDQAADKQRSHAQSFDNIANAAGMAGAAIVGGFGLIVHSAMQFDSAMSAVSAASDATSGQMEQLREAAISAGAATKFSATEAAEAETELAKAGISTADILGGALTGSMSLAAAGGLSLADAATDAAQAMKIFGLGGQDVGHIADVLAAGANKSAADVKTLADAMKQGGLAAANAGLSLEETVGTLAAFADNAMVGSDSGTSLKTMLMALSNPSKESALMMQHLGIAAYDAGGAFVGITALAEQLRTKLGGLTQAERDQAMAQIFGSDATRAATVLYRLGAEGVQEYVKAVNSAGAADDTAREKMNNLSGDVEQLKGSFETLTVQSGSAVSGGLRDLTQAATRAVNAVGEIPAPVATAGMWLTGLTGVAMATGAGLLMARNKVKDLQESLTSLGPVGAKASGALGATAAATGKLTVALVALQTASAAMGHDVSPSVQKTAQELEKLGESGKKSGDALSHLSSDLGTLGSGALAKFSNGFAGVTESLTGLGSVFDESLYHAKERISAIDQGMAALVSAGKTDEAAKAFDRLAKEGKKAGISMDDLKAGLPLYEAAIAGANKAQLTSIAATERAKAETDLLGGSLENAVNHYGSLKDAIDGFNGAAESTTKATIDAEKAVDDLSDSLTSNGATLDLTTQKGRDNQQAIFGVTDAARDAAQATYAQTGSLSQAQAVYSSYIGQLQSTMKQAGFTQGQIDALTAAYAKIPREITTTIHSWTIYHEGKATQTDQWPGVPYRQQRWGGVTEHAAAGLLRDAQMFSGGPTRYAFAEPSTGGEAFIPRLGDLSRSRGIAEHVVRNWLGGQVSWRRTGSNGGGTTVVSSSPISITVTVPPTANPVDTGREVVKVIRQYQKATTGTATV
jgi:TP901 family phage tail tape measure protein